MLILVLLLSIKLQMPICYWILFTIIVLIKPILKLISIFLEEEIKKSIKEISSNN